MVPFFSGAQLNCLDKSVQKKPTSLRGVTATRRPLH